MENKVETVSISLYDLRKEIERLIDYANKVDVFISYLHKSIVEYEDRTWYSMTGEVSVVATAIHESLKTLLSQLEPKEVIE